eukprot:1017261-Alexandrium_andersonii.AAC.1
MSGASRSARVDAAVDQDGHRAPAPPKRGATSLPLNSEGGPRPRRARQTGWPCEARRLPRALGREPGGRERVLSSERARGEEAPAAVD